MVVCNLNVRKNLLIVKPPTTTCNIIEKSLLSRIASRSFYVGYYHVHPCTMSDYIKRCVTYIKTNVIHSILLS